MPSPLGHALGGFAAGWLVAGPPEREQTANGPASPVRRLPRRALAFALLGVAADLDLLIGRHSQFTHSIGMAFAVGVLAFALQRSRGRDVAPGARPPRVARPWVLGAAVCAAYASHILLDWLAQDATPPWGITALWPFNSSYYLSRLDVFWGISREPWRPGAAWHDALAILREILLLAAFAWGAWWLRRSAPVQILPTAPHADRQQLPPDTRLPADGESRSVPQVTVQ